MTMHGLEPVPADGRDVAGGARLVNDGWAAFYLLPFTGGAALVDCGDDAKGAAVLAELKKRSLTPDDVKAIFLTHGHPDHIASCHLFTKAEVYGFGADQGIAAGTERSAGPIPRLVATPKEKLVTITKTLTDGETTTLGDRQVIAFAVPGHTRGSAAYLSNGLLMLGDSAQHDHDGSLRAAMWLFTDDPKQNRRSLQALATKLSQRGDKVDMTAYGHSGPSEGMRALAAFRP
jgi:glyoxylase-like metal-dependent hydrolase (beta-lactamase superfamily II)